jgi:carboxymethylenebutenolidase
MAFFAVVAPVAVTRFAAAQGGAAARKGEVKPVQTAARTVTYKSGEEQVSGYLAAPTGAGPFPAIVLIHEWWGLNDWVKQNARRFAERGYVALALDLYRGKVAVDRDLAHELSRGVPEDRAARDLLAAVAYVRSLKEVNAKRVGAIGWCMGGGYSLTLALRQSDLSAAVICYGRLATDRTALQRIEAAILGIFGGQDRGIPVSGVRQFEQTLRELHKPVEIHVYAEAGHAFMNPGNQGGYRKADAEDAWQKIDAFFQRTLGSAR